MSEGPNIYARGAVFWTNFTVAGQHFRLSTGKRDRGEASERAVTLYLEACQRARVPVPASQARDVPLSRAVAVYLKDLARRLERKDLTRGPFYYKEAETHLRVRVVPRWSFAHEITTAEWSRALADWHAAGSESVSWRTLQSATVAARAFLRWAEAGGYIAAAPRLDAPAAEAVTVEAKERRPFTEKERDAFLRAAKKIDARMARIYTVLFFTACRKSDVERLQLRQVDLVGDHLRFPARQTKSRKPDQEVWLHPRAAQAIRAELRERKTVDPAALVFGPFNFKRAFAKMLEEAKIGDREGLTAHHVTRHTAATLAGDAGATLVELLAMGRWSTPAMAMRYMKVNAERSKGGLERL